MRFIIKNGLVIDPANRIRSKLNIAIKDGKIEELTMRELQGDQVLDAQGLVVAPGFVDLHMHEDPYNVAENRFEVDVLACMLRMGVTTAIGGNCGIGPENPEDYMDAADRLGLPVNLGLLVPHGSLRTALHLTDRYGEAPLDKVKEMAYLAEHYLDRGCLGISYGIRYIPGLSTFEMAELNKVVFRNRKLVAAHLRDDATNVVPALNEFIQCGLTAKGTMQVSHIGSMAAYGQMADFLALLDATSAREVDIAADCYPYAAFCTKIGSATFDEGFIQRYGGSYERIEVSEGEFKGQRLNEDLYHHLRQEAPETLVIAHVMNEDEVDMALSHPNVIIASDGILNRSQGHPRAAGSFPRFIKRYVREKKLLGLCEAIAKITCQPAQRIGIAKGTLGVGRDADITIFDYAKLSDRATFAEPTLAPEGVEYVILKGQIAYESGYILRKDLGRVVRK